MPWGFVRWQGERVEGIGNNATKKQLQTQDKNRNFA